MSVCFTAGMTSAMVLCKTVNRKQIINKLSEWIYARMKCALEANAVQMHILPEFISYSFYLSCVSCKHLYQRLDRVLNSHFIQSSPSYHTYICIPNYHIFLCIPKLSYQIIMILSASQTSYSCSTLFSNMPIKARPCP
jgi:hypothetical protein